MEEDNFSRMELLGRDKFESLLQQKGITTYHFTQDKYNPVDCYFVGKGNTQWMAEIKVRDRLWDPLFMEALKYKEMKQIVKDGGAVDGLYVNFIGDRCYIFTLSQITKANGCYVSQELVNRYTAINADKVYKQMICLPINIASVYEWDGTSWNDVK